MTDRTTTADAVQKMDPLLFSSLSGAAFALGTGAGKGFAESTPARLLSFASIIGGAIQLRVTAV